MRCRWCVVSGPTVRRWVSQSPSDWRNKRQAFAPANAECKVVRCANDETFTELSRAGVCRANAGSEHSDARSVPLLLCAFGTTDIPYALCLRHNRLALALLTHAPSCRTTAQRANPSPSRYRMAAGMSDALRSSSTRCGAVSVPICGSCAKALKTECQRMVPCPGAQCRSA